MASSSQPQSEAPVPRSLESWKDAVRGEERRGELLAAFDLAERGLDQHPDDVWLEHRAVLALARAGASGEAERRFESYGLGRVDEEDVAALRARIAKDLAVAAAEPQRRRLARHAGELYGAIAARTKGYYPAINAATMSLLAGEEARSRELAALVLGQLSNDADASYYAAATEAEAHLLLGEQAAARRALHAAAERHGGDYGALATTRRQLRLICELTGVEQDLLEELAGPTVVHFCGHRIGGDGRDRGAIFSGEAQAALATRIAQAVRHHRAGYAYGSLASGADILWAEALLEAGSELHVVLPFAREEFVARSVEPAGAEWVRRFARCMDAASTLRYATEDAYLGDDILFRYGSELAMGLALLRARYLDAEARQLAVWDGAPARAAAGTALDIGTWRRTGGSVTAITPDGETTRELDASAHLVAEVQPPPAEASVRDGDCRRVVRAMLFGDIKGFSKLTDEQLPSFATNVLGAFAEVLDTHREAVGHRNTWGDAVYVVLSSASAAAACALDLQDAMAAIDLESVGLPMHLALRLGGHLGPVFPAWDPVLREMGFMGSHVSRTARIEPVTPPTDVYVTEPFAAALMLGGGREFACEYVGHMPAAKDYGRLRMYRLRRVGAS
jgi:Adenylate and Guanylate cyclase catalytic domain